MSSRDSDHGPRHSATRKTRWLIAGLLLVSLAAPPIYRTIQLAGSADGLLLIASATDEQFSWNPWSKDCYLVRQDTAVAILKNWDWPYERRNSTFAGHMPLIHRAISARAVADPADAAANDRLFTLLEAFVARGLSIDEEWDGYSPLHQAILFGDTRVVELLLREGADLDKPIDRPGKASHGLTAVEFVELMYAKSPDDYAGVRDLVEVAMQPAG